MLALRMRQKDAEFYFVSYPARDLLQKVRFVSRFYGQPGQAVGGGSRRDSDDVERFIQAIEKSHDAFQRKMNHRKVRQIRDFYANVHNQPAIPGAVLLFTPEKLHFETFSGHERTGDLSEPQDPFLIIDGQHRLAGLHFYLETTSSREDRFAIDVPCIIFDGKTSEFATEMFVVINSTHTRINKSHIVDLYEKIEWGTSPEKKLAARVVKMLYKESDSPLRYHINMLGGRSQRSLWINQAQLFREVHQLVLRTEATPYFRDGRGYAVARGYGFLRDVFRAAKAVFAEAWGKNEKYMVTRDVTLKALVRVAGDVAVHGAETGLSPGANLEEPLTERFAPWNKLQKDFRREGFYERFAARGPVERVEKIRRRLSREAGLLS